MDASTCSANAVGAPIRMPASSRNGQDLLDERMTESDPERTPAPVLDRPAPLLIGSLMAAEVVSLACEIVFRLVLAVFEACVYILAASVRPWRYLLSQSFRTE